MANDWTPPSDGVVSKESSFTPPSDAVEVKKKDLTASGSETSSSDRLSKTTTKPTASSSSKGKPDGIYSFPGQDDAIYKKENGEWYKAFKSDYKYLPITKGDVAKRIGQLENNAISLEQYSFEKPEPKLPEVPKEFQGNRDTIEYWKKLLDAGKIPQKTYDYHVERIQDLDFEESVVKAAAPKKQKPTTQEKEAQTLFESSFEVLDKNDPRYLKNKAEDEKIQGKLKIVTPDLIGQNEDDVVPAIQKIIKDYPYLEVDYAGFGYDALLIRNKITKEEAFINLDNWSNDRNNRESEILRGFLEIQMESKKYVDQSQKVDEIKNKLADTEYEWQKVDLQKQLLEEQAKLKKLSDARYVNASNNKYKSAAIYDKNAKQNIKTDFARLQIQSIDYTEKAKDFTEWNNTVNDALKKGLITQEQYESDYAPKLDQERNSLISERDKINNDFRIALRDNVDIDNLAASEYAVQADRGNIITGTAYSFLEGAENSLRFLLETGAFDQGEFEGLLTQAAPGSISDLYTSTEGRNVLEQIVFGLANSGGSALVGAAIGAQWLGLYASSYVNMKDQMSTPEFANVPEYQKILMSGVYGATIGLLEGYGVSKWFQKTPAGRGLTNWILKRTVTELGKDATAEAIELSIKKNLGVAIKNGLIQVTASGLVEGSTELAQEAADMSYKDVFNKLNGKEYFDNPKSWAEVADRLSTSFILGFAGGAGMNAISQTTRIASNELNKRQINDIAMLIEDNELYDTFKLNLKDQILSGEISKEEAKRQIDRINELEGTLKKIPSNVDKFEAFKLITERDQLQKEIAGKDPALVAPQIERVNAINDELKQLSYAVQEQKTSEVPVQPGAGVGAEMAQGEPKTGLKETTQEGKKEEIVQSKENQALIDDYIQNRIDYINSTTIPQEAKDGLIEDIKSDPIEYAERLKEDEGKEGREKGTPHTDFLNSLQRQPAAQETTVAEKQAPVVQETVQPDAQEAQEVEQKKQEEIIDLPSTQNVGVLITPATVRNFSEETGRLKELSLEYDTLVKEYSATKNPDTWAKVKQIESEILNNAQKEIEADVAQMPGVEVEFGKPRMGLWDGKFEPSFNMNLKISEDSDTTATSEMLINFAEKYSQDAFILETDSDLDTEVSSNNIDVPYTEFDGDGMMHYPQISYTFVNNLSDQQIADLSNKLQDSGITAFSLNDQELKISVITFLEDNLSEDEQFTRKEQEFRDKLDNSADAIENVLGDNGVYEQAVTIKRSSYQGAKNEGSSDQTRQYDRSDVLKPISKKEQSVADLSKKLSRDRILQADTKDATNLQKALDALDKIEKDLDQFGKETLGVNIPVALAKTIVKAVKSLVKAGVTLEQAIKQIAAEYNLSDRDVKSLLTPTKVSEIDVNEVRSKDRPGKRISKGLSVKTVAGKKVIEETEDLSLDYVKKNAPKVFVSNANIIAKYPLVAGKKKFKTATTVEQAQEIYDVFVREVADNLNYLMAEFKPEYREISTLWYDGANAIANDFADQFGVSAEQAAGIIAAMSPQKDWYQNVRLAEMVLMAYRDNPVMTKEMIDYQKGINKKGLYDGAKSAGKKLKIAQKEYSESRTKANKEALEEAKVKMQEAIEKADDVITMLNKYIGKNLNDVPAFVQPYMVRTYHEVNTTKDYNIVAPDGSVQGVAKKNNGSKAKVAWGSYSEIGKAVAIKNDGSQENITRSLGEMHKIRNFYNNIIDPMSKDGDVTMDTHAIAAALFLPLSGKSTQVSQNFGTKTANSAPLGIKGLYYAYADAYALAAKEAGLLPRQVQSITWEAVRGLYTDTFKGNKAEVAKINNIWKDYQDGKITIDEAREQAKESAGGIKDPTWAGPVQTEPGDGTGAQGVEGRGDGNERDIVGGTDGGRILTSDLGIDEKSIPLDKSSKDIDLGTIKSSNGNTLNLSVKVINLSYPGKYKFVRRIEAVDNNNNKAILSFWIDKNSAVILHVEGPISGKTGYGSDLVNMLIKEAKNIGLDSVIADNVVSLKSEKYWEDKMGFVKIPNAGADRILYLDSNILTADTKNPTVLKRVENALNKADDDLAKFGRETLGINIPVATMRAIIKLAKVLVKTGITLQDAIIQAAEQKNVSKKDALNAIKFMVETINKPAEKVTVNKVTALKDQIRLEARAAREGAKSVSQAVKAITAFFKEKANQVNLTRAELKSVINIISSVKDQKTLDAAADKIYKIVSSAKSDVVEVNQMQALKSQIRLEAKAAREAKGDLNTKRKALSTAIAGMVRQGKIKAVQARSIINKVSRVNLDNPVMVERLINYAEKVFDRADYQETLSKAAKIRKSIKRSMKSKDIQAEVVAMAKKFSNIDPFMVEDIDQYIQNAENVLNAVRAKKDFEVALRQAADLNAINEFSNKEIERQEANKRAELLALNNYLVEAGIITDNMTAKEIQEMIDIIAAQEYEVENADKKIEFLKNRFEFMSGIIKEMIVNDRDIFTDESLDLTPNQKEIMKQVLKIDMNEMSIKEAAQVLEAMDNFINNGITSGLKAVVENYQGKMNANRLAARGLKSRPLKLYFSKAIGRLWSEQIISLPLLVERMFNGMNKGLEFINQMGLNDAIRGAAKADYDHKALLKNYSEQGFYNEKGFMKAENVYERGMLAFLSRNLIGTETEIRNEFLRRIKLVEESIDLLLDGTSKEAKIGEAYQKVYDKLKVDSQDLDVIKANADKMNTDAVDWMIKQWAEKYSELSDVSLSVYNSILGSDINYTPDRFKTIDGSDVKLDETLLERGGAFMNSLEYTDKNKSGVLMETTRPKTLPKERYVSLDFDANNFSSLKGAMVDIETAAAIRKIDGFMRSDGFKKMINSDDRKILKSRINEYIIKVKGKTRLDRDTMSSVERLANFFGSLGVGKALGGLDQAVKQTAPVVINTIINAGRFDALNTQMNEAINRSGMPIANRGLEASTNIEAIDSLIDKKGTKAIQFVKGIEKVSQMYMKALLSKPDVWVARSSFISYYKQYLNNNGISTDIDWQTHEWNQDAMDYAQMMVDRQQNISDEKLAGKFLSSSKSFESISRKVILPFATFILNQKSRMQNDFIAFLGKESSLEEKKKAARSIVGLSAELLTYQSIAYFIKTMVYDNMAAFITGDDDDEEKKERSFFGIKMTKKQWNATKFPVKSLISDLLSPFPLFDEGISLGFDTLMSMYPMISEEDIKEAVKNQNDARLLKGDEPMTEKQEQEFIAKLKEQNTYKVSFDKDSYGKQYGSLGIAFDTYTELAEMIRLASTGEFEEEMYGRTQIKHISKEDQETVKWTILPMTLFATGIVPKDFGVVSKKVVNNIKRKSINDTKFNSIKDLEKELGRKPKDWEEGLVINTKKKVSTITEAIQFAEKWANLTESEEKEYAKYIIETGDYNYLDLKRIEDGETADQILKK